MFIGVEKLNEAYCRLEFSDHSQMLELREFTSFYAPNYKYNPKFKARIWDGKVSYYDARKNLFPIGCLPELGKFCKRFSYELRIPRDFIEHREKFTQDDLNLLSSKIFKETFKLRDYQEDAIIKAINSKRGVVLSSTGSGKSSIQYAIIRQLLDEGKKILLVVPSINLVSQMYSDFEDYGFDNIDSYTTRMFSGQTPNFKKQLLITTYQSLLKKDADFFERYNVLINDECHSVRSVELQNIAKKCYNAEYRLGFTGTLPREPSEMFNVYAMLGPVIFEQRSKELIDRGLLSNITVVNTFLKYPRSVEKDSRGRAYHDEINLIETTPIRHKFFKYLFEKLPDEQNTLILVNHIEHLKELETYIANNTADKYQLYVIHGQIDGKLREEIRKTTEQQSNVIILASFGTMSVGVNIKKLHNVVFAASSKSEIRVLQSIGRGLRLHETKSKMILWDVIDDFSYKTKSGNIQKNHVYKHWETRARYYQEQGFDTINRKFVLEEL